VKVYPNFYLPVNVRPLGDLVLVHRIRQVTTPWGLVLQVPMENLQTGVVLRVGPAVKLVKEKDTVFFLERTGQPIYPAADRFEQNPTERDVLAMHEMHIAAVVDYEEN